MIKNKLKKKCFEYLDLFSNNQISLDTKELFWSWITTNLVLKEKNNTLILVNKLLNTKGYELCWNKKNIFLVDTKNYHFTKHDN